MKFLKAFKCHKCPENNTEQGCPAWMELTLTNPEGAIKIQKGCFYILLPVMLIEVIKASNRPAAAIESMRNAMVETIVDGIKYATQLQVDSIEGCGGHPRVGQIT